MKEKIGYSESWNSGADDVPASVLEALSNNSELNKKNETAYRDTVVPGILNLNSTSRWRLINDFEARAGVIPLKSNPEAASTAMKLVNAHEVLICAEIQCYLRSEPGKAALKSLHLGTPVASTSVTSAKPPALPELTLDKFNQLAEGMSYAAVVKIIGGDGIDRSKEEESKLNVKTYKWENGSKSLLVVLTEDKLKGKYKANL